MGAITLQPKRTHFKRKRHQQGRTPQEAVTSLVQTCKLHGLLQSSAVWVVVTHEVARLLEDCVLGIADGGPQTGAHVIKILVNMAIGEILDLQQPPPQNAEQSPADPQTPSPPAQPNSQPSQHSAPQPQDDSMHQGTPQQQDGSMQQSTLASSSRPDAARSGDAGENVQHICIRLSLEEAMYMANVLRCLTVYSEGPSGPPAGPLAGPGSGGPAEGVGNYGNDVDMGNGDVSNGKSHVLTVEAFWTACCKRRAKFWQTYTAFQHFRSKGYFPRSGIQYGCAYVLYQHRPAVCHSDFGVIIVDSMDGHPFQWFEIQIANRLASQVSKRLILLYVNLPEGVSPDSPDCVARVEIGEVRVGRWTAPRDLDGLPKERHQGQKPVPTGQLKK